MLGLWAPKRVIHHIHLTGQKQHHIHLTGRAKMNLAGHRDRRLSENYFEPWKA